MLQAVPHWLGHLLSDVRAGYAKLAIADPSLGTFDKLDLTSLAFADGARLPERFTADGEGVSPPLMWHDPPVGTAQFALLVEDADSPTPQPLIHALVWNLAPETCSLVEGAIVPDHGGGLDVGRNSYGLEGWLPPDPPTGHGEHRYAFQLFALDAATPHLPAGSGRTALHAAIRGHVVAAGVLVGTYSRGDPAGIGPVGAIAPAAS